MYKLLLCWRYLRTRYIALASIISVMLGVATMIVVNSVMSGFAREMQNRIHGILSDVVLEVRNLSGVPDADWHMQQIRRVAGDAIEGMTATVVVPAMLNYRYGNQWMTKQVQLIGIDETTQSQVSDFGKYLQHPENRKKMGFQLREGGYDTRDHQGGLEAMERPQMKKAGWERRRLVAELQAFNRIMSDRPSSPAHAPGAAPEQDRSDGSGKNASEPFSDPGKDLRSPRTSAEDPRLGDDILPAAHAENAEHGENPPEVPDPFARRRPSQEPVFNPAKQQHTGAVLGIVMASFRRPTGEESFLVVPGDDVKITFPTAGTPPKAASDDFTIVDFYECKMAEYDSSFVFVPIRKLQELRGMIDPATGLGMFNSIQIKLKPGVDGIEVRDKLAAEFSRDLYVAQTWRDKQGALLAAVQMETAILNVLLFLIIAVSGFGILAIFFMIVVEKTRDIGILKSLGASGAGIMGIFLSYGLSLGLVGSGVGLVLGLVFVDHINDIAVLLGKITGRPVFDPSIYYFYRIPTLKDPWTIAWIVSGAIGIAVLASVLPALRAALLRPVEALRYE
jgi:lipoprotein-releasing system permease protein